MRNFTKTIHSVVRHTAVVAVAAAALSGSNAYAAAQGTLGATSTGSIAISATVPNRARITGLTDVTITNQDPNTAVSRTQNVCVWSNTATKGYSISATGSGASSAFTLGATGGLTVPYSVSWAGSVDQTSGTALTSGTGSSFTSAATQQICSVGTRSATLLVEMTTDDLGGMQSQTSYTGTLTLMVTPE
jgi:hypothetical protein